MSWSAAAKLALELVAAGRLAPGLRRYGADGWVAGWRAALVDEPRIAQLAACMPPAAHALVREDDEVWSARGLLIAFCDAVADACVRASRGQPITPRTPSRQSVGRRWIEALTGPEPMMVNAPPHTVLAPDLGDRVTAWSASVTGVGHASARLCLQLHTPDSSDSLSSNGEWSLAYLLQAAVSRSPGASVQRSPPSIFTLSSLVSLASASYAAASSASAAPGSTVFSGASVAVEASVETGSGSSAACSVAMELSPLHPEGWR